MVFKRRDRRPFWRIIVELLWPRGGWGRAARYVRHRLNRLPDPPHRIARGIFAGVFTTFTPFYGMHFVVAATLALILRGNVLAALLSTFFGNPLTYVPIGVAAMKTGYWLLDMEGRGPRPEDHTGLVEKFLRAGSDLWDNLMALFTGREADWTHLNVFYDEVFFPYMIGGIIPGMITALVMYYLSLPLITAYQNRRKGALKKKLATLKKKKAESHAK
ncbi:DUF2062 domain-containing protein [Tropicibacter naphthalenivorans]|uniref:DUF2062 domain-containing protein n=1 Tax=Tropicibacter naphthalenivorans TaxID=441103 RepID=A0A0P1GWH0_9RHOB|nr:DUF2062 domain-containing protein [Tropicibacter naphthalenivorans]CUH78373.1 hypothetical protein TRN7648_01945 [Tropicibacter naphthalenivorans]SMC80021.1 hypothetical protein SAMN04488093_104107 [Tropicibacter naphthalenivorans]